MIRDTQLIMGMPITLMTPDVSVGRDSLKEVFDFFRYVDQTYSPFIASSVVSQVNAGELGESEYSEELRSILAIATQTKEQTNGYFDVWHKGVFDPSGIVKGWAIAEAARIFRRHTADFYVEAGGDIQVNGHNQDGNPWQIGVRNPFDRHQNIKVVTLSDEAIATSGTAIRGQHIYDPVKGAKLDEVASISVIAKDIVDADRMATAAFAMGRKGIYFIEQLAGFEACAVMADKTVITTTEWAAYEVQA